MELYPSTGIRAIKYYREHNKGASLIEAKSFVDRFCVDRGLTNCHSWSRLTLQNIEAFMSAVKSQARNKRYQELVDMVVAYNRDYGTAHFIDE